MKFLDSNMRDRLPSSLKGPLPFICLLRPKWATYQRDGDGLKVSLHIFVKHLMLEVAWLQDSCQLFAFRSSCGNDVPLGCKELELLGGTSIHSSAKAWWKQNVLLNVDADNQYWANNFNLQHIPYKHKFARPPQLFRTKFHKKKTSSVLTTIVPPAVRFHWWKRLNGLALGSPEATFLKKVLNLDGLSGKDGDATHLESLEWFWWS